MRLDRLPLLFAAVFIALAALGYLISETVPIFVIAVLGLPVAAYALNRANPPRDES